LRLDRVATDAQEIAFLTGEFIEVLAQGPQLRWANQGEIAGIEHDH
jgi:hypothetical protein